MIVHLRAKFTTQSISYNYNYKLQGYLLGKYFECETDHNNLQWIEALLNPAIIRMRVFLQSFHFDVRHIPGKLNSVADYLYLVIMKTRAPKSLALA